jgi:adenylate kinase
MNIVLIGAQGSGKGTQAELLSQALNIQHISSGDLFRKAFDEQTALGLQAKAYVDRGELVPDSLTVSMVLEAIRELHDVKDVLFDGFPRTVAQAQALDEGLQSIGKHIDHAVYLNVPREELLKRLSGRLICRAHQHVYNIYTSPPRVAGVCDIDDSELYQRSDDTGPAVQRRLGIFFSETIHILNHYSKQHKLVEVNGNQSVEQVHMEILKGLHRYVVPVTLLPSYQVYKRLTSDADSSHSSFRP